MKKSVIEILNCKILLHVFLIKIKYTTDLKMKIILCLDYYQVINCQIKFSTIPGFTS